MYSLPLAPLVAFRAARSLRTRPFARLSRYWTFGQCGVRALLSSQQSAWSARVHIHCPIGNRCADKQCCIFRTKHSIQGLASSEVVGINQDLGSIQHTHSLDRAKYVGRYSAKVLARGAWRHGLPRTTRHTHPGLVHRARLAARPVGLLRAAYRAQYPKRGLSPLQYSPRTTHHSRSVAQ